MNPVFLAGLFVGIFLGAVLTIYAMVRASRKHRSSVTLSVTDSSGFKPGDNIEVEGQSVRVTRVGIGSLGASSRRPLDG